MSLPRQIIPGSTYMVTRRCTQRQFLLTPSALVNRVFLYCLAVAAKRTGVVVHAFTVMSNHYHLIVTDPFGRLPDFYGWLHEFVGKCLNVHYDRSENFWSSEATNTVLLVDTEDILAETVYTLNNPVAAGLVSRGSHWPGLRVYAPQSSPIERPKVFFRENGPTPAVAELRIVAPPVGTDSDTAAIELIERTVRAAEEEMRAVYRAEGRRFLGKRAIRAQHHTDSPDTPTTRGKLAPRFACRNKWLRMAMLQLYKQFVAAYREAWRRWCSGVRDVVFPAGTFQMARTHGVLVADH